MLPIFFNRKTMVTLACVSAMLVALRIGYGVVANLGMTLMLFGPIIVVLILACCMMTILVGAETLLDAYGIGWFYGDPESESAGRFQTPEPKASKEPADV